MALKIKDPNESKDIRVYVNRNVIAEIKEKFSETKGMTATGVADWALRYLLKIIVEKEAE